MEIIMVQTNEELQARYMALKAQVVILKADVTAKKNTLLAIYNKCEREVL
jgi:hypothetical protein